MALQSLCSTSLGWDFNGRQTRLKSSAVLPRPCKSQDYYPVETSNLGTPEDTCARSLVGQHSRTAFRVDNGPLQSYGMQERHSCDCAHCPAPVLVRTHG